MANETVGKRPDWIRVKAPSSSGFDETLRVIKNSGVLTVCEEALCPNISECWKNKTATFLIMGDICTRMCGFCSVKTGKPTTLDEDEPMKIANVVKSLGIKYSVITSVTRDDLKDGGANHFSKVIKEIKKLTPEVQVEILTPDFQGDEDSIKIISETKPDVFGHNIEIVKKLHTKVKKPPAGYHLSISFLKKIKNLYPSMITKTGMMVGVGEDKSDVFELIDDMIEAKVDILTIGQYLTPSTAHYPIIRYVTIDEFEEYKKYGEEKGLKSIISGPLVRSSYKAREAFNTICHFT